MRNAYKISLEKLNGRGHLGGLGVDRSIKWNLTF